MANSKPLVSDDGSLVSRRIFRDPALYQLEQQYIFAHSWLYVGHESQLRNSGDFLANFMGETPVIVARGEDGHIHVSINSCSHRGVPVCRADFGNAKRFVCPYHNWSYSVEGNLMAVPQEKLCNSIDKSALGLKQVPRVEIYNGLIFACLDAAIEPLETYLGDMRYYLDCMFDRYPNGVEVIGAAHKWQLQANWKLPVENQLGDVGHGAFLHGSLLKNTPQANELEQYGLNVVPRAGHGVAVRLMPPGTPPEKCMWGIDGTAAFDPEVHAYLLQRQQEVASRLGEVRSRLRPLTYSVYPNFSYLWGNNTIRISHPRGPNNIEYWSWWVIDADAPEHIKQKLRMNYTLFFGPGGLLEQEDAEAWSQQIIGNAIEVADDAPYYYGLGLGEEKSHPEIPGLTGSCYNEHYAREFYLRWFNDIKPGLAEVKS
jgi:phenylpropionate dioxygenase-like ring-hydroxylating dioxygenase large terminal subunit